MIQMRQRQNIQRLCSLLVRSFAHFHIASTAWVNSHKKSWQNFRGFTLQHGEAWFEVLSMAISTLTSTCGSTSTARWLNEGGGRTKTGIASGSKPEHQTNKMQFSV